MEERGSLDVYYFKDGFKTWQKVALLVSFVIFSTLSLLFLFKIDLTPSLTENTRILLVSCVFVLIYKIFQIHLNIKKIFSDGIDLGLFLIYIFPACFFIFLLFSVLLLGNTFIVDNINYAMETDFTMILPFMFYLFIFFSVLGLIGKRVMESIANMQVKIEERTTKKDSRNIYLIVAGHTRLVVLGIFVSLFIVNAYAIDFLFASLIFAIILIPSNYLYYHYKEKYFRLKTDVEKKRDSNYWYISWLDFGIVVLFGVGVYFYIVNLEFQSWVNPIFSYMISLDPFTLAFGLIVVIFYLAIPVAKLIGWGLLFLIKFLYKDVVKGYFNKIMFSVVIIFLMKIFVFNIEALNWPEWIEWCVCIGVALFVFALSTKLNFAKGLFL